jgi:hypothetical protein
MPDNHIPQFERNACPVAGGSWPWNVLHVEAAMSSRPTRVFLLKTPHATVKKSSLCPRFTCPRRLRTASPMSFLAVTPLTHCWCLPGTTLSGCTIPLTTFKCISTPTRLPCSTRALVAPTASASAEVWIARSGFVT